MASFDSSRYSSSFDRNLEYTYDIDHIIDDPIVVENPKFLLLKNILSSNTKISTGSIDAELIKYCFDNIEELSCSLNLCSFRGVANITREELMIKILEKSKKIKTMIISFVNPRIDLQTLSTHTNIEYLEFKNYGKDIEILSEPIIKKEKKLIINLNKNYVEIENLNKQYNEFNIFFV
jgi:hypothetical protein